MKELNEMTIGRTDDPENPISVPAFEAAKLFGAGSRNPSGPADMVPRQQAGHMRAIDPPVKILFEALASEGPSTHARRNTGSFCHSRRRASWTFFSTCPLIRFAAQPQS